MHLRIGWVGFFIKHMQTIMHMRLTEVFLAVQKVDIDLHLLVSTKLLTSSRNHEYGYQLYTNILVDDMRFKAFIVVILSTP
jgi:hypothetical protein